MRAFLVVAVGLAGCGHTAPIEPAPTVSLNLRVLSLIGEYPAKGHGGYAWPAAPGTAGTTRDLQLGSTVIAHGGSGNHCVGMTLEVFWRAVESCAGGPPAALDVPRATELKRQWYVPRLGGAGPAEALPAAGLGVRVAQEDALPGDFVQAWNHDETFGHSMVFLGWKRDAAGQITGIKYWSSQPWTDGIGISEGEIGEGGFDLSRIYIARATCRG